MLFIDVGLVFAVCCLMCVRYALLCIVRSSLFGMSCCWWWIVVCGEFCVVCCVLCVWLCVVVVWYCCVLFGMWRIVIVF